MKRFVFFVCLFFSLFFPAHIFTGMALALEVNAPVVKAVLFPDRTLVTRGANIAVGPGEVVLSVSCQPFEILEGSASATLRGDGKIISVETVRVPGTRPAQEKIASIKEEMQRLRRAKRIVKDQMGVEQKKIDFLDSLSRPGQKPENNILPDPASVSSLIATLGKAYSEAFSKIRDADAKLAEIEKELKRLSEELDQLTSAGTQMKTQINILFDSGKKQEIDLQVSYLTGFAGWKPEYRADVDTEDGSVTLSMRGRIVQKTGEDWKDIELTLSTAQPAAAGRLPEIGPWWIDTPAMTRDRKMRAKAMRKESQDTLSLFAMSKAAPMATAKRMETASSFEYRVKKKVSVPSREKETTIGIFQKRYPARLYHWAVPAVSRNVFLACEIEPDPELLAGPVKVFHQGSYIAEMFLDPSGPEKRITFGLGIDRSVLVEKKKVKDQRIETFFGRFEKSRVTREIRYETSISNRKDRDILVYLQDRIPVSKTDKIEVTEVVLDPVPAKKDVDSKPGVMQWELRIKPKSTQKLNIGFTVTYPRNAPPRL